MSPLKNKNLLAQVLEGKMPSTVLNLMLVADPELDKYVLANVFLEEFDRLDSKILPVIWKWKSTKSIRGISDQQLDEAILAQMRMSGYMVQLEVERALIFYLECVGAKDAGDWAKLSGQLTEATKGKGDFGIGCRSEVGRCNTQNVCTKWNC